MPTPVQINSRHIIASSVIIGINNEEWVVTISYILTS